MSKINIRNSKSGRKDYYMKKIPVLATCLILTFILSLPCFAKPVNLDSALAVGKAQLRIKDHHKAAKANIEKDTILGTREINEKGKLLAYVFDLAPEGYIVISPDTDISPVIAYSYNGSFLMDDTPDNVFLHLIKWDMDNRLSAIPLTSAKLKNANNDLWGDYMSQDAILSQELASDMTWGPWLETAWHQNDPYNKYCPIDPATGKRSVVGCVGTVMVQILNYWSYPKSISFSWDADHYVSNSGTLSEIKIDEDYQTWDFPSFTELSQKLSDIGYDGDIDEIAALSFACGIIARANYRSSGSSAIVNSQLYNRVGYLSDYLIESDMQFYPTLRQNMKDAQPAQMSIRKSGTQIGHSIVVDGFKDSGEFYHLNYGWGDTYPDRISECWYSLPSGMPAGYNTVLGSILNIIPASDAFSILSVSGDPNPVDSEGIVQCSVSVADPLSQIVSYKWEATVGFFSDTNIQNPTWTAPINNTGFSVSYTITVTATCSSGASDSKSYQQAVKPKPSETVYISLKAGWNLVSLPGELIYPSPDSPIQPESNIANPFYKWDPASFSYVEATGINPGEAYWMLALKDIEVSCLVNPVPSLILNLKPGWNMIGGVNCIVDFSDLQDDPDNSIIPPIYTYNPSTFSYLEKPGIEPCVGYWVLVLQECSLTISCASSAALPKARPSLLQNYPNLLHPGTRK